jgi:hypothetical protein
LNCKPHPLVELEAASATQHAMHAYGVVTTHRMAAMARAARAHRWPSCREEDREGTSVSRVTHRARWRQRGLIVETQRR